MSGTAAAVGGAVASGVATMASNLGTNIVNLINNERNIDLQNRTNAQNERLMREAWARDDTARQRMVADYEAAGLSKWLAAGASPMTSSPVSMQSPQSNFNAKLGGELDAALAAYSNMLAANETKAQTDLIEQQRLAAVADTKTKEAQARVAEHDADVLTARAGASNDPAYIKYLDEGINTLSGKSSRSESVLPAVKTILGAVTGKPTVDPVQAAQVTKLIINSEPVQAAKKEVSSKLGELKEAGKKKLKSFGNWTSNLLDTVTQGYKNKHSAY